MLNILLTFDYLFEILELVFVCGSHRDDLCPRFQVLSYATWVAAIFIKPDELWDFVVFINQINDKPCVVVQ